MEFSQLRIFQAVAEEGSITRAAERLHRVPSNLSTRLKQLEEQMDKLVEQAHEIDEMQRNIMMSQIQPHFLYNSLNTIYYLCEKDPEKAQQAVSWFSDYLRGNLDSLKCRTTVTFETELDHVKVKVGEHHGLNERYQKT